MSTVTIEVDAPGDVRITSVVGCKSDKFGLRTTDYVTMAWRFPDSPVQNPSPPYHWLGMEAERYPA